MTKILNHGLVSVVSDKPTQEKQRFWIQGLPECGRIIVVKPTEMKGNTTMKTMKSFVKKIMTTAQNGAKHRLADRAKRVLATLTATALFVTGAVTSVPATEVHAAQVLLPEEVANDPMRVVANEFKMYRLYNPNSGEHFYTKDNLEMCNCINGGWRFEGLGWMAPKTTDMPVYRIYNPNDGYHHYTTNQGEYEMLVNAGWSDEGIQWYSSSEEGAIPLYREYNPNNGQHNYTSDWGEHTILVTNLGWNDEGIAWYGNANSLTEKENFKNTYGTSSFGLLDTFIYLGDDEYQGQSVFYYYYVNPKNTDVEKIDNTRILQKTLGKNLEIPGDESLVYGDHRSTKELGHFAEGDVCCVTVSAPTNSSRYRYYQVENHRALYNGYYRTDLHTDGHGWVI